MERIKVIIEKSNYGFSAYMDTDNKDINYHCIGEGKTIDETIADFKNSYEEIKEYSLSKGEKIVEVEFDFVRSLALAGL